MPPSSNCVLRKIKDFLLDKSVREQYAEISGETLARFLALNAGVTRTALREPKTTYGATQTRRAPTPQEQDAGPASRNGAAPDTWKDSPNLDSLYNIICGCMKCRLGAGRNNFVFGEGDPKAKLMFVGEGPGRDEDMQGRPFVGRAGQLLTKMINAMQFERKNVYIANVVKCRPPENRIPERDEAEACIPYLMHQINLVRPTAIVLLGATPARFLLGVKGINEARGKWFEISGVKTMPTYHPAFLLRNPLAKKTVWADLQLVMALLGKKNPEGGT